MKCSEVVYCIAGKEDNVDMNAIDSDLDRELTSAAMSAAAMAAAAAATADADADGWQMCDVETRPLPPDWHNYVSCLCKIVATYCM